MFQRGRCCNKLVEQEQLFKNNSTSIITQNKPLIIQNKTTPNSEEKLHKLEEEVLRLLINYGNKTFVFEEQNETRCGNDN